MRRGFEYRCPPGVELPGEGAVRHCAHCRRDVYDLSRFTRGEAVALLADDRPACVALRVEDGRARFRSARTLGRLAQVGLVASSLAGCGGDVEPGASAGDVLAEAAQRLEGLVAEAEADARSAAQAARAQTEAALTAEDEACEGSRAATRAAPEPPPTPHVVWGVVAPKRPPDAPDDWSPITF